MYNWELPVFSCVSPWSTGEVRISLVMIEQGDSLNITSSGCSNRCLAGSVCYLHAPGENGRMRFSHAVVG